MKKSSRGTAIVLIIDLVAAMGTAIFATVYLRLDSEFLLVFSLITFGLLVVISLLLRSSPRPASGGAPASSDRFPK
jgi:hypothetical protein